MCRPANAGATFVGCSRDDLVMTISAADHSCPTTSLMPTGISRPLSTTKKKPPPARRGPADRGGSVERRCAQREPGVDRVHGGFPSRPGAGAASLARPGHCGAQNTVPSPLQPLACICLYIVSLVM